MLLLRVCRASNFTSGAYFSEGANLLTGGSDGDTYGLSLNYGLPLGAQGGFVNFTGSFESRGWTSRMREWEGSVFNPYNAIEWEAMKDGAGLSKLSLDGLKNYAGQVIQTNIIFFYLLKPGNE